MQAARMRKSARYTTAVFVLVGVTECLIVLGALVRAHEAGLACPDWPLCFGEFLPQMNLEVAFEWSHRVLAGGVSVAFAALAVLVLRSGDAPHETRRWLALAAVLLVIQVLLGALTVWQLLASWTVTSHLVTGNSFALTLLFAGLSLRESGAEDRQRVGSAVRAMSVAAAALLALQLVLGGLVSSQYAGMACPEWPACNGGVWFPSLAGSVGLHLLHRWNAVLLAAAVLALFVVSRREPGLRIVTGLGSVIVLLQVVVGIANVLLGIPVEVTGLHSALAAALVLAIGAATRAAFLPSARTAEGPEASAAIAETA